MSPYTLDPIPGFGPEASVDPHRAVLLIQDMTGPLIAPFDLSASTAQFSIAVRRITRLADAARNAGVPVVYVDAADGSTGGAALLAQLWRPDVERPGAHRPGGGRSGARRSGAERADAGDHESAPPAFPDLAPVRGDTVLSRSHHSAFTGTDLRHRVRGWRRDQLIVTGVYAHIGCLATATAAAIDNIEPFLVPDATADLDEERHREGLEQAARVGARVRPTADILRDLKADPLEDNPPPRGQW